jgi:osmotically-inducible protein OsmY
MDELSQDMGDTWITAKAKSVLLVSKEAEGASYQVSTVKGTVTVTGTVMSEEQKADIEQILHDLEGVQEVDNKLTVR